MANKIKTYFLATRPQFFTAVIIPATLGTAIAFKTTHQFNGLYFTITIATLLLCHGSINILNDYFDHKNGTDEINTERLSPFTGGSRVIQDNILSAKAMLNFGIIITVLAIIFGIYLIYELGSVILIFGIIGLSTGILYSSPFIFLASRGLGEFFVWLNFGVLTTTGAYYVQTQTISKEAFIASLPVAFLITAVLFINEFPDYTADKVAGKTNLVVRIGKEKARFCMPLLMASTYISLISGVIYHILPLISLIALLGAPIGLFSAFQTLKYSGQTPLLEPAIKATIGVHFLTGLLLIISYLI